MGFSYNPAVRAVGVRTGTERATLVRRTYALVFASVVVTILGAAFAVTQPSLFTTVAQHPFITFLCALIPLWMAMRNHRTFPQNLGFTFLFTFIEGIWISPLLVFYERMQPGILGQAGLLVDPDHVASRTGAFVGPGGHLHFRRARLGATRGSSPGCLG